MLSCLFGYLFCSGSKNNVEKPTIIKSARGPFGGHLFKPNFTRLGHALLDQLILSIQLFISLFCQVKIIPNNEILILCRGFSQEVVHVSVSRTGDNILKIINPKNLICLYNRFDCKN